MNRRALTALGLFVGFYLISALLIAGLLALPVFQMRYGEPGLSSFLALVSAGYVAWAMLPRREKWIEPGTELTKEAQPRLWSLLERVAIDAGHPTPKHVYLLTDVQAFAGSRPRWFGLRREPTVGLGLPVFAFLSEREIRAVIAHEMGHHAGGDVKLGAWQYRTSRAIESALHRLEDSSLYLNLPYYAYGQVYLRLTRPAAREQELHADALAARLAGGRFLGSALVAVEQHSLLWPAYFHGVVVPTLNEGFLPPLIEGYERYIAATDLEAHRSDFRTSVATPPDSDDTHPPLRDRLRTLATPCEPMEIRLNVDTPLLSKRSEYERRLLATGFNDPAQIDNLKPLSWDEWGETILPRVWFRALEPRIDGLRPVSLAAIPEALQNDALWERLRVGINVYSDEARANQRRILVTYWCAHLLHEAGYRVVSGPGAEVTMARNESSIQPFRFLRDIVAGARTPNDWAVFCAGLS